MENTLDYWQMQIRLLNARLIDSDIELDEYRKELEILLCEMGWQARVEVESLVFA